MCGVEVSLTWSWTLVYYYLDCPKSGNRVLIRLGGGVGVKSWCLGFDLIVYLQLCASSSTCSWSFIMFYLLLSFFQYFSRWSLADNWRIFAVILFLTSIHILLSPTKFHYCIVNAIILLLPKAIKHPKEIDQFRILKKKKKHEFQWKTKLLMQY